jgi:hypothetical protein
MELVKEATRDLSYGADAFEVVESRIETHLDRIESEGIIAVPTILTAMKTLENEHDTDLVGQGAGCDWVS